MYRRVTVVAGEETRQHMPVRRQFVAWVLFLCANSALAGNAVFGCSRADNGARLPCSVRLVPYDTRKRRSQRAATN
jgi:hypothetical protein